jgi:predicted transcriptional regulator
MGKSAVITVRVSSELKDRLVALANQTRRTSSFLAAEAIAGFVESESEILASIERARDDVREGRTLSHDDAMARFRSTIEKNGREE